MPFPVKWLALCLVVLGSAAVAQSDRPSYVSLLPGWQDADGTRWAGVRISLAPGWKTYWRSPLGNGIPPQFDWSGSSNVAGVRVHWPAPEVFETYGVKAIGYSEEVVFPVELRPEDPSAPVGLSLVLFYGVCEEVCIPVQDQLSASLAPSLEGGADLVRAALAANPRSAADVGYASATCALVPAGERSFRLTASLGHRGTPAAPELAVIESGMETVWIVVDQIDVAAGALTLGAQVENYAEGPLALDRSALRLTLFEAEGPVEVVGCPAG